MQVANQIRRKRVKKLQRERLQIDATTVFVLHCVANRFNACVITSYM